MTNKPETRLVYTEADLDRLVAGDKVQLDKYCPDEFSKDLNFPCEAAYGGNVRGTETFLVYFVLSAKECSDKLSLLKQAGLYHG